MLRHDLFIANPLRKSYLSLLDSPNATCTMHALAVAIADFLQHQFVDVPSVGTKQFALVRTLPEMCALEICDGMRSLAGCFEDYPLRCEVVVSPDRP
jgi:hypothetical protein